MKKSKKNGIAGKPKNFKTSLPNLNNNSRKITDKIEKGELFTFEFRVKRKNGKINVQEKTNEKSIFCEVTESVRNDNKWNVRLIKRQIIARVLDICEVGFGKLKNYNSSNTRSNDPALSNKKPKNMPVKKPAGFLKDLKKINEIFKKNIAKSDMVLLKKTSLAQQREKDRAQLEEKWVELETASAGRIKLLQERLAELQQVKAVLAKRLEELAKNDLKWNEELNEVKKITGTDKKLQ